MAWGHVARMGEMRNVYKMLVGKPEWKRPFMRHRHRWNDTIKMDIKETGCKDADWIHLAQYKIQLRDLVNTVIYFRVPKEAEIFLNGEATISF
jgi:hypothetical protein